MGKQQIRQQARRQALGAAAQQRQARVERERRVQHLVVQVLTAIGERDAVVIETERRAGAALQQMTRVEGLSAAQALKWCGNKLTMREVTRLRRLSTEVAAVGGQGGEDQGGEVGSGLPAG